MLVCILPPPPLPPLGHIWDVMLVWRKANIEQNCLCATVLCTVLWCTKVRAVLTGRLNVSAFDLGWFRTLSSECLCVFSLHGVIYILKFFCLHPSLYLLMIWAWWDWFLTWLTNHCLSVLWHCWLGHLTHKIVSEMTCNVSSGTLNPTIPIPQFSLDRCRHL